MCHPRTCRTCGLTTWSGCGRHVDLVKATVSPGQWCPGHATTPREGRAGWLGRIVGGRGAR